MKGGPPNQSSAQIPWPAGLKPQARAGPVSRAAGAVKALVRVHAAGFFKQHRSLLGKDPDLVPRRGRADFKKLLNDARGNERPKD